MKKIVILGGGMGAISAAFELTSQPGWQEKYSITVYQLGWRLGGKGASGRGPYNRIEEHGLHVWFAAYANAFDMMRRCYAELERDRVHLPLGFSEAFVPQEKLVIQERIDGRWIPWVFNIGGADGAQPGTAPRKRVSPWVGLLNLLSWLHERTTCCASATPVSDVRQPLRVAHMLARRLDRLHPFGRGLAAAGPVLHRVIGHLDDAARPVRRQLDNAAGLPDDQRRLALLLDLCIAMVRGLIADGALLHGYDALDPEDLRVWLARHGAHQSTLDSALLQALYDLLFAYPVGQCLSNRETAGNLAAGVGVRAMLGMFAYERPVLWKLGSSMGDTIFTPLYLALKRRNVQFKFFHRVTALHPSADGRSIESIELRRQARLLSGRDDDYFPLDPDRLAWPAAPRVSLLVPADRARAAELESTWGPEGEPVQPLMSGRDFDVVILGIPLGALGDLCSELTSVSTPAAADWRRMLQDVQTVRTQAVQLWFQPPLGGLGWPASAPAPLVGGYAEPLSTWADMSHLLTEEGWPESARPKTVAYFCGVMPDDPGQPPPFSDPCYPGIQTDLVKQAAHDFLESDASALWPATTGSAGFDWDQLVDPEHRAGPARLDTQFWRANIEPSERYVTSIAGTTGSRLRPDGSGFANLLLVGDWTRSDLNCGTVESAVISARYAVRALVGAQNLPILGPFHRTTIGEHLAGIWHRARWPIRMHTPR